MSRDDIEAAIAETLAALRSAVSNGWHESAHTYSVIIERLHALLLIA